MTRMTRGPRGRLQSQQHLEHAYSVLAPGAICAVRWPCQMKTPGGIEKFDCFLQRGGWWRESSFSFQSSRGASIIIIVVVTIVITMSPYAHRYFFQAIVLQPSTPDPEPCTLVFVGILFLLLGAWASKAVRGFRLGTCPRFVYGLVIIPETLGRKLP